jgi:hypothetical protein
MEEATSGMIQLPTPEKKVVGKAGPSDLLSPVLVDYPNLLTINV